MKLLIPMTMVMMMTMMVMVTMTMTMTKAMMVMIMMMMMMMMIIIIIIMHDATMLLMMNLVWKGRFTSNVSSMHCQYRDECWKFAFLSHISLNLQNGQKKEKRATL